MNDIIIEEEPYGEHFAEFQIGLNEIPNGFIVDTIVYAANLAAPLRLRLTRMYNNKDYDIRRFILDSSPLGDILSDHSGACSTGNDLKLSFGRSNNYYAYIGEIYSKHAHNRNYAATTKTMDVYRLDFAILCESENHVLNYDSSMHRWYHRHNSDSIGQNLYRVFYPTTIAKASIILSESELDALNSCFYGNYTQFDDVTFTTSFSKLSEHSYSEQNIYIDERFFRENTSTAKSAFTSEATDNARTRIYSFNLVNTQLQAHSSMIQEYSTHSKYKGNNTWHEHKHFDTEWNKQWSCLEMHYEEK